MLRHTICRLDFSGHVAAASRCVRPDFAHLMMNHLPPCCAARGYTHTSCTACPPLRPLLPPSAPLLAFFIRRHAVCGAVLQGATPTRHVPPVTGIVWCVTPIRHAPPVAAARPLLHPPLLPPSVPWEATPLPAATLVMTPPSPPQACCPGCCCCGFSDGRGGGIKGRCSCSSCWGGS